MSLSANRRAPPDQVRGQASPGHAPASISLDSPGHASFLRSIGRAAKHNDTFRGRNCRRPPDRRTRQLDRAASPAPHDPADLRQAHDPAEKLPHLANPARAMIAALLDRLNGAAARRLRGLCAAACGAVDRPAGRALSQPAARPDRGADLRPRVAARLRQAAAAAVVADRGRLAGVRGRLGLLPDRPGDRAGGIRPGVAHGAPPGRAGRRARRGADRRRAALLQLHGAEVQSRRDPAAVLGAGRARVPWRAARRAAARLVPARDRRRDRAVGEIFRRHAGAADGRVSRARPRRAAGAAHRRPLRGGADRRRDRAAASRLAGRQRLPAVPLRRGARRAGARADRSPAASARVRGRPDRLAAARGRDRAAAGVAAPRAAQFREGTERHQARSTRSIAASSRCSHSGRAHCCSPAR